MSTGGLVVFLLFACLAENTSERRWRRRASTDESTAKHGSHPGKDRPVYIRCRHFLNLRHQIKKENFGRRAHQPLGPLCRPNIDKFMKCFEENIYNSTHPYDVVVRTNTNFFRVKNATTKLCEDYKTYKPDMSRCLRTASRCISPPHMNRHMIDSHRLCLRNKIRCDYDAFSKCDIKGAMMASRYFFETNSNGCILTDPLFQLLPHYGPELSCYSFIDMQGWEYMNLAQIYDRFCKGFDVNRVLSCIVEKFPSITSDQLLEERVNYVERAKTFANDRHEMCKSLFSPENNDCMRDGESVDLSDCQNDMFVSAVENDHAILDDSVEKYADCIFDKYMKCNPTLATILRDNIKTWN